MKQSTYVVTFRFTHHPFHIFHYRQVKQYELLLGARQAVRWVRNSGHLDVQHLWREGVAPVEGGREDNGTPLAIARAEVHEHVSIGKASAALDGAYVTVGEKEVKAEVREKKRVNLICC